MATRSTICLVLKKDDIGKELKFDEKKLPKGLTYSNEYIDIVESVVLEKPILEIYHHWDGYPKGVGMTLLNRFNDYDTILNLLLGGNASSINGDNIVQYCAWRGDEWRFEKPLQMVEEECVCSEEYIYKFDDDKWYFKGIYDEKWIDLKEYIETYVVED